jgi:hypothetical protein
LLQLDNGLPTTVCVSCLQSLDKWVSFKSTCETSYKILKDLQSAKNQLNIKNDSTSTQRRLRSSSHRNKNVSNTIPLIKQKNTKKTSYNNKKCSKSDSDESVLNKKYKLKNLKVSIKKLSADVINTYIKTEQCDVSKVKIENTSHTKLDIDSKVGIKIEGMEDITAVRTALISKLSQISANCKKGKKFAVCPDFRSNLNKIPKLIKSTCKILKN